MSKPKILRVFGSQNRKSALIANPSLKPRAAYNRKTSAGLLMAAFLLNLLQSIGRSHRIVREVHVAVCLGPQANPA